VHATATAFRFDLHAVVGIKVVVFVGHCGVIALYVAMSSNTDRDFLLD
jgi:hypothetical protein